jgi:hypothetical protein
MPKPIDAFPEFQPKRTETLRADGTWIVTVTPPAALSLRPAAAATVVLSDGQFNRYLMWKRGELMIQEALPELSSDDRERLMTGLLPDNKVWRDEED